jgi:iron-sulfur cluster repair protein YtfE (RIC family)
MENKPLKRNENIRAISKDHHWGLLFCWKIKTGLNNNIEPERLKKYLNHFWEGHLKGHFHDEEVLLFSRVNDDLCNKGKLDHQLITALILKIIDKKDASTNDLQALIEMLQAHIRFEERILFPHFENILSSEILLSIGDLLAKEHNSEYEENYPDNFWVVK